MSDEGKLFIGGLSFETNEESLAEAFGKYGNIEKVDVIRDKETGRSRGFGFVKYDNVDDAKDAMTAMNGKSLDGRAIRVDEAGKGLRPRGGFQSAGRFGGQRGSRGGRGYSRGSYGGDRSYGDRSYGERSYGGNDRGFGGSGGYRSGGYSSGGGGGGYRDNRGQGGYERNSSSSYRDSFESYAAHE